MTIQQLNVKISAETIAKMRQVRKDTGIPISQIVERSFLKSDYNDAK